MPNAMSYTYDNPRAMEHIDHILIDRIICVACDTSHGKFFKVETKKCSIFIFSTLLSL